MNLRISDDGVNLLQGFADQREQIVVKFTADWMAMSLITQIRLINNVSVAILLPDKNEYVAVVGLENVLSVKPSIHDENGDIIRASMEIGP